MDEELDFALALSLQQTFYDEIKAGHRKQDKAKEEWDETRWDPKSIVDGSLELTDPNPNIHDLFVQYDAMFFWRRLVSNGVVVRWSPRMTMCAGVCAYEGRGGLCSIRLSQPLLKLRSRKDLVETLLHEMIHAYLFVTENYRDHDGHGPKFLSHMHRINGMTGARISVYHNFHDEVREYRQHWWKCNGPCQYRPPFYGLVKRSMNRAPSARDPWWSKHQMECGGTYEKIKEPENYGKKKTKQSKDNKKPVKSMDIRDMFKKSNSSTDSTNAGSGVAVKDVKPFEGSGHRLIDPKDKHSKAARSVELSLREKMLLAAEKRQLEAKQQGTSSQSNATQKPHNGERKRLPHGSRLSKAKAVTEDIRQYCSDTDAEPKPKKPKLATDDAVIIIDSASPKETDKSLSNSTSPQPESDVVIDLREEAGPSSAVLVLDDAEENDLFTLDDTDLQSDDLLEVETGLTSPSASPSDFRTCPVCGMSNIPKAIINAHTVFCLDAEEESQLVDDDDL